MTDQHPESERVGVHDPLCRIDRDVEVLLDQKDDDVDRRKSLATTKTAIAIATSASQVPRSIAASPPSARTLQTVSRRVNLAAWPTLPGPLRGHRRRISRPSLLAALLGRQRRRVDQARAGADLQLSPGAGARAAGPASWVWAAPTSAGEIDVDDLDGVIALLGRWHAPPLSLATKARIGIAARRAPPGFAAPEASGGRRLQPSRSRHTRERDAEVVRHHYDVSNDFFELFLDETMTYSCALFEEGADTLEDARRAKLDLICRKVELTEGGACLTSAAAGAASAFMRRASTGPQCSASPSPPQAELANQRAREAGSATLRVRRPRLPRPRRRRLRRRRQHRHGRARRRLAGRRVRPRVARVLRPGGGS